MALSLFVTKQDELIDRLIKWYAAVPREVSREQHAERLRNFAESLIAAWETGGGDDRTTATGWVRATGHPALDHLLQLCATTLRLKGDDYTAGRAAQDLLAHFRGAAADLGEDVPLRLPWFVLVNKHWQAVKRWVRTGEVASEPLEGRLLDIINYCLLGYLIWREEADREAARLTAQHQAGTVSGVGTTRNDPMVQRP